jgi:hypothetical protein
MRVTIFKTLPVDTAPTLVQPSSIIDLGAGRYTVNYVVSYGSGYQITVTFNNQPVPGSPFNVHVVAGRAVGSQSQIFGAGVEDVTMMQGYVTNFTLVARDNYGNQAAPSADYSLIDVYLLPALLLTGMSSGQLLNGSASILKMAFGGWVRGIKTGLPITVIDLKNGNYEIDYIVFGVILSLNFVYHLHF